MVTLSCLCRGCGDGVAALTEGRRSVASIAQQTSEIHSMIWKTRCAVGCRSRSSADVGRAAVRRRQERDQSRPSCQRGRDEEQLLRGRVAEELAQLEERREQGRARRLAEHEAVEPQRPLQAAIKASCRRGGRARGTAAKGAVWGRLHTSRITSAAEAPSSSSTRRPAS